jgi:hypothetical protein
MHPTETTIWTLWATQELSAKEQGSGRSVAAIARLKIDELERLLIAICNGGNEWREKGRCGGQRPPLARLQQNRTIHFEYYKISSL